MTPEAHFAFGWRTLLAQFDPVEAVLDERANLSNA